SLSGRVCDGCVLPGGAETEAENYVNFYVGTDWGDCQKGSVGIDAREQDAPESVSAATDSATHLRLCREPGRGAHAHRLDGHGPDSGKPRSGLFVRSLAVFRSGGGAGGRAAGAAIDGPRPRAGRD